MSQEELRRIDFLEYLAKRPYIAGNFPKLPDEVKREPLQKPKKPYRVKRQSL